MLFIMDRKKFKGIISIYRNEKKNFNFNLKTFLLKEIFL
jgi:hypothetical protein